MEKVDLIALYVGQILQFLGQCYSAYSYGNDIRETYYYRFLLPLVTDQIF